MKNALQITSWIAIILGVLTIFSGFSEPSGTDASYSFIGGLMFSGQGLLAILYIKQTDK